MNQRSIQFFSCMCVLIVVTMLLTLTACGRANPQPVKQASYAATPTVINIPTVVAGTETSDKTPANRFGVHLLLDDGRHQWPTQLWREHMRYALQAVGEGGYVTQLVRIDDLHVERWQTFMDLCNELQLIPVIRLATTFDRAAGWWRAPAPDADGGYHATAAQFATFLGALKWPTDQHYIIVGNEPNRGDEWGGRPDPVAYGQFLVDVAAAVRAHDDNALIMNAGLDLFAPHSGTAPAFDGKFYMDAETFMDQLHAANPDAFHTIDLWSSHSYPLGPFSAPPWQQTFAIDMLNDASNPEHVKPPADVYNRGVNGYVWELFKLSTYGVSALPVMITETGWRHAETTDANSKDTGAALPSAETGALFLDLALYGNNGRYPQFPEHGWTPWLSDSRVMAVTPFAFNGVPSDWGHTNWLMLDDQGFVLGTYAAVELLSTGNAQP